MYLFFKLKKKTNKKITYCNEIFKVNHCNIWNLLHENLVLHKPIAFFLNKKITYCNKIFKVNHCNI